MTADAAAVAANLRWWETVGTPAGLLLHAFHEDAKPGDLAGDWAGPCRTPGSDCGQHPRAGRWAQAHIQNRILITLTKTLGIFQRDVVARGPDTSPLVIENKHTGERLELRRLRMDGEVCLELRGSLPPRSEGPPLHIHFEEHEEGKVHSGVLTALVDGKRIQAGSGQSVEFPRGSAHRWWNEGEELLEFTGYARPVVDLDRYLQAVFQVVNAGPPNRPPII